MATVDCRMHGAQDSNVISCLGMCECWLAIPKHCLNIYLFNLNLTRLWETATVQLPCFCTKGGSSHLLCSWCRPGLFANDSEEIVHGDILPLANIRFHKHHHHIIQHSLTCCPIWVFPRYGKLFSTNQKDNQRCRDPFLPRYPSRSHSNLVVTLMQHVHPFVLLFSL